MKTKASNKANILFVLWFVVFGIASLNISKGSSSSEPNRTIINTVSEANTIKPIEHQELLDVLEKIEKGKDATELNKTFKTFKNSDKLETIAYALQEGLYPNATINMIRDNKELQDKRIGKFFPGSLRKYKDNGSVLYGIVGLIKDCFPDPNLVPSLLDYAVESDYWTHRMYASPFGTGEHVYDSVFKEVAEFLMKVSKGKMVIGHFSDQIILPGPEMTKERAALIQKWRAEWPKVQQALLEEQRELQMEIHPIAHKEIIDILIEMQALCEEQKQNVIERDKSSSERTKSIEELNQESQIHNKKSQEILKKIRGKKRNDKLETIAYAMTEGLYPDAVMTFVWSDTDLHDKRLVPFIAETIKNSTGRKLYMAVEAAYTILDKSLLPLLIDYALDSDYIESYGRSLNSKTIPEESNFLTAAKTIYKITNGKIGHNLSGTTRKDLNNQKDNLIKQWRKIYDETLKKDYEKN
jgi:hypothetical protein